MPTRISNPSAGSKLIGVFNIGEGGHGKTTAYEGLLALGGFPIPEIGQPNNPIPLNAEGKIDLSYFGNIDIVEIGVEGPMQLARNSVGIYYLTTYDQYHDYAVTCEAGQVSRKGKWIYYQAPDTPGQHGFKVDLRPVKIQVLGTQFEPPRITSPDHESETSSGSLLFTVSTPTFINHDGREQLVSTDWELSEDETFTTRYRSAYHSNQLTSWQVDGLKMETTYYVRVRFNSYTLTSPWSPTLKFKTVAEKFINKPSLLSPINEAFGVSLPVELVGSTFQASVPSDVHMSTDWLLSTTANFSTLAIQTLGDVVNKTIYSPASLEPMTLYYVKFRYRSAERVSEWSTPVSFVTQYPV